MDNINYSTITTTTLLSKLTLTAVLVGFLSLTKCLYATFTYAVQWYMSQKDLFFLCDNHGYV